MGSWKQNAKKCPFCGNETHVVRDMDSMRIRTVYCRECRANFRFYMMEKKEEGLDENEARWLTKWNRRWKGK